jgi:hypothetical protein
MKQKFTQKIPNEIYIDDFSDNKVMELEYNGPDTLLLEVDGNGTAFKIVEEARPMLEPTSYMYHIELNAADAIEAAHYIYTHADEHIYENIDIPNPDGSIYIAVSNPRIQDYYRLTYQPAGLDMPGIWHFNLITRSMHSTIELKVINDYNNAKKKLSPILLTAETQTAFDDYTAKVEAWIADTADLCPWKYIEFPAGDIPKLPLVLIRLIAELDSYGVV